MQLANAKNDTLQTYNYIALSLNILKRIHSFNQFTVIIPGRKQD